MAGRQGLRLWASLGGVAFVVLAVVGSMLLFDGPTDSSPANMAAYYGRRSHQHETHYGWALTGLGLFCLIWFVAALRERVRESDLAGGEHGAFLSTIVLIGGTIYTAVALAGVALTDAVKTMSDDTYHHQVYSGIVHAANDATYVMVTTGGAGMAAAIFAVVAATFRFGILPRWLGWSGIVAGLAAMVSIFFFPMLLWMLWLAIASVALFLRARAGTATTAEEAPAAA